MCVCDIVQIEVDASVVGATHSYRPVAFPGCKETRVFI